MLLAMLEDSFQPVTVVGGGIAFNGNDLVDAASSVPPFNVDQQMDGVGNAGLDGLVREVDAALQDATGQPRKSLPGGIGMDGGKASAVAGVEGLQKIKGLLSANLSQDGALGPVPQAGLEQVADSDGRDFRSLLAAGLEADQVRLANVDFGGVLNDQQAIIVGNEVGQDVKQGGLPCTGPATDEDVFPVNNGALQEFGHGFGDGADAYQIVDGKTARIEFADGEGDALDAARRQDGGNAAPVRQAGIEDGLLLGDVISQ